MKSLYHIRLYIRMIIIVCMAGTNAFAGNKSLTENKSLSENESLTENHSLPDSLITDDCVYEYTFSDFDKAERIMKELRKRKSLPDYRLDVTEGDLYYNRGYFHRALKYYKRALDNDSVRLNDERYMEQIHRMISLYDYLHNDVAKAKYIDTLLKKAEQCGNAPMKAVGLFNMGKMLYYQGNKDKGYELMNEAAAQMEQTDYRLKYDNLRYHYNTLFAFLLRDCRYEEALATLETLKKVVTSQTGAEIPMEGLADKEKKTLYAQYAKVLVSLKRTEEADDYYRRFLALAKENDYDNHVIMTYLFNRKMYDELISMSTKREKKLAAEGDTVTYHMTTVKKFLGRAYEEKGNYRAATRYYKELAVLRDSIKNREQKSTALELAALYETHEKDLIIQQQDSDAQIRNFWLALAVCVTVLLSIILCLGIRYYRKIQFKNNALVKNINELLHYKDEIDQAKDANLALKRQVTLLNNALETLQAKQKEPLRGDKELKVNEIATATTDRAATVYRAVKTEMAVKVDKAVTAQRETDTTGTNIFAETEEYLERETNAEADAKECLEKAVCGDTIDGDKMDGDTIDSNGDGENENAEPRDGCMDAELGAEAGDERYGKELYEQMEHLIISGQLYLDPSFSGEKARKLVGIPRNRFVPFIKQYTGDRFLKYLNRLRIYHAARLLQENPDCGIETVARESGIPALRSFHRLFLEEFEVTPTEYRKKSKLSDN
ncbi:helix-turn-helix domain-containing protein [Bacteroides timonensis]|uniref:helix-turn-helix domain-containing protein n=1 Tax=Bacteroides timonensis TaxID=1470345 RepID=UPI0004AD8DE0|nr:helix-turn-helix domain-containing protein [Bacteroides timonensis]